MYCIRSWNKMYMFWHESVVRSAWYVVAWGAAATKFKTEAEAQLALKSAAAQGFTGLRVEEF